MFVVGKIDPPFTLFIHPHKEVPITSCSLEASEISHGSTVFVEYSCGSFDPSMVFGHPTTVCTCIFIEIKVALLFLGKFVI